MLLRFPLDKAKLLVIDDEVGIRRFLRASLPDSEFEVKEAVDGKQGLAIVAAWNPDVILLDLGLPDLDGIQVAQDLRTWTQVPIIVLSARGQEQDKVDALDAGADDYLTKPFGVKELMARIRVALRNSRRAPVRDEPTYEFEGLKVDFAAHRVWKDEQEVHLTPIEFKLLATLAKHAGKVVTHRQLLTEVWGPAYADETHYLRVYTAQIRHKIESDPAKPRVLRTEPGVGYRVPLD